VCEKLDKFENKLSKNVTSFGAHIFLLVQYFTIYVIFTQNYETYIFYDIILQNLIIFSFSFYLFLLYS